MGGYFSAQKNHRMKLKNLEMNMKLWKIISVGGKISTAVLGGLLVNPKIHFVVKPKHAYNSARLGMLQ